MYHTAVKQAAKLKKEFQAKDTLGEDDFQKALNALLRLVQGDYHDRLDFEDAVFEALEIQEMFEGLPHNLQVKEMFEEYHKASLINYSRSLQRSLKSMGVVYAEEPVSWFDTFCKLTKEHCKQRMRQASGLHG